MQSKYLIHLRNIIKNRYIILLLTLISLGVVVVMIQAFRESNHTINGTLTLNASDVGSNESVGCFGKGGYDDISSTSSVTIRDGSDKIIATSVLGKGELINSSECTFNYALENVPRSDIYQVEVSDRGKIPYSFKDMKTKGFIVDVTLGK